MSAYPRAHRVPRRALDTGGGGGFQRQTGQVPMRHQAHQQEVNAIHARVPMEAQCRASMAAGSLAPRSILIGCLAQRKAAVQEDALHRRMYGAAARRDVAYIIKPIRFIKPVLLSVTEQLQLSEYAVPMVAAQHAVHQSTNHLIHQPLDGRSALICT